MRQPTHSPLRDNLRVLGTLRGSFGGILNTKMTLAIDSAFRPEHFPLTFCRLVVRASSGYPSTTLRHSPITLIHDSTLFDGADERQFTQALHLARLTSQTENFQYLCCLNSDRIPTSGFPDSFDWRNFVKLTLRDGAPDGGLFGFCFGEGPGELR